MDKRAYIKAVVLSLAALTLVMASSARTRAEEALRVGIITALSGSQKWVGQELRDGALLAIESVNQDWKGKGVRIEAVVMDDGASPGQAGDLTLRLIKEEKVDLLFGLADSDCALRVAPLAAQARVPMLTLATHAGLTHPLQKWIFRGNISDGEQAKILVDLLWDKIQGRKVGLLYEDTEYGRSGAAAELKRIRQYGVTPAAEVVYPRGEKDFSSALKRIQEAGVDGLLIYGVASDAEAILERVRKLGMGVTIMASSGWDTHQVSRLPSNLTEGIVVGGYLIFANRDREEELGPSWAEFAEIYRKRFGREPDVTGALSYSNLMSVAQAYARVDFRKERLAEGLEETKTFNTLLETRINYTDESHDGFHYLHLAQFQEGKPAEWKRNLFARDYRFKGPSRQIQVGEYQGKINESEPGITVWLFLHFAFGRPPFLREFPHIDDYGFKACYTGVLFKGEVRVSLFKLVFRSEKDAIEALNFEPPETGKEGEPQDQTDYRDADSGVYTDGTLWSGYKRDRNIVFLIEGGIPRDDLRMILDADFWQGGELPS
jgi:branched-chain amino acid transport system substrate-binding protein